MNVLLKEPFNNQKLVINIGKEICKITPKRTREIFLEMLYYIYSVTKQVNACQNKDIYLNQLVKGCALYFYLRMLRQRIMPNNLKTSVAVNLLILSFGILKEDLLFVEHCKHENDGEEIFFARYFGEDKELEIILAQTCEEYLKPAI
ncbi:hypothetical protein [Desulfofalx alkaliphila]|uniref:hypothetical protein n=1 Tax=Desulfofalx alkaliphila TaxID=105483 RepID=UPI0004E1C87E|nr:hypothetical protein [Desulfofalx alkaliphila]